MVLFTCPRCSHNFSRRQYLHKHLISSKNCDIINDTIKYICSGCDKDLQNKSNFIKHISQKSICTRILCDDVQENTNKTHDNIIDKEIEKLKLEIRLEEIKRGINIANHSFNTTNNNNTTNNTTNIANNYKIINNVQLVPLDYINFEGLVLKSEDFKHPRFIGKKILEFLEGKLSYICRDRDRQRFSYLSKELEWEDDHNSRKMKEKMMREISPYIIKEIEDKLVLNQIDNDSRPDYQYLKYQLEHDPEYYTGILKMLSEYIYYNRQKFRECLDDTRDYKEIPDKSGLKKLKADYRAIDRKYQTPKKILQHQKTIKKSGLSKDNFIQIRSINEIKRGIEKSLTK